MQNRLLHGDCLVEMKSIPDKSIDMILVICLNSQVGAFNLLIVYLHKF